MTFESLEECLVDQILHPSILRGRLKINKERRKDAPDLYYCDHFRKKKHVTIGWMMIERPGIVVRIFQSDNHLPASTKKERETIFRMDADIDWIRKNLS